MNPSIYVIGAQCTGKTTIVKALQKHFADSHPKLEMIVVSELARDVLRNQNVTREHVQAGDTKAMQLQQTILETQFQTESASQAHQLVLSDRSGLDPIAYALKYGEASHAQALKETEAWESLRSTMQRSVVILCEPVVEWLVDDGERLMPKSVEEWLDLHETFVKLLHEMSIEFKVLPSSLTALKDRVGFVLSSWDARRQKMQETSMPHTT